MKIWRNEPNIHPRNPSSCTQAVTARLCKMSVDADVDVDASARAKLWCHWAEEAQAPSPQVNSTTSWRWLWRWRSSAGKIMEDLAVWWFCMILRWWRTLCNPDFENDVSDSLCVFGSSLLFPCPLMSFEHLQPWLLAKGWFSQPRNQNAWDQRLPLSHALMTELHVIRDETGIKCPSSWSVCKACDHRLHSWRWGFTVV